MISTSVDEYQNDTEIQSLHSLAYVNRAKKFIEKEGYDEAEDILLQALELPQKDALVYKYLGLVYDKQKNFEKAVEVYQSSAEIGPLDKNVWQKLGFALIAVEKYVEAEKSFENSNRVSAGNTDTYTGWGMSLMKQGEYEQAREKFSTAVNINKYNFSAIFLSAVMDINLEEYDKAESKLIFLANVTPNETNTFEYAHLKFLKGDYETALRYANISLEHNSCMLPSYLLIAKIHSLNFNKDEAISSFETAEARELTSFALYFEWGLALERFHMYSEAKEKFLLAMDFDNKNPVLLANLALMNALLDSFDDTYIYSQMVSEIAPDNKILKLINGIIDYEKDEFSSAVRLLKDGMSGDFLDAINSYYLAKCYEKMNDEVRVKDYYEAALQKNPVYLNAYLAYAKFMIDNEDYAEAKRKLRKAMRISPENTVVLNALFFVGYKLEKENSCEFNIKELFLLAEKIKNIDIEKFLYDNELAELIGVLEPKSEHLSVLYDEN
ncbi:MAG: tetratricopeptide repeat protein [Candidatus Gastranaerophilales bacterium]